MWKESCGDHHDYRSHLIGANVNILLVRIFYMYLLL
jgi:hypothetical protein